MTTATEPPVPTVPAAPAQPETVADLLHDLGDVPPERVRMDPPLGQATIDGLIAVNDRSAGAVCELTGGTLVEKAVGQLESWIGMIVGGELYAYLKLHDLGMLYGEAAVMEILPGVGRAPDVSFLSWKSLPGGKPPPRSDKVPSVVPDLVVEVLSASNTPREMARKRDEYFRAGVKLVWEVNPESRSANVFTAPNTMTPVPADGTLDGGDVLPGFTLSLAEVFARADGR